MGKNFKKISLGAIAFLFGMIIIFNSYGEKKVNQEILFMQQDCQERGFSFVKNIYENEGHVCLDCLNIQRLYDGKMAANQITLCTQE